MPTLKLDTNSRLYAFSSNIPMFTNDEVEIWLYSSNKNICIFKDSHHDVLLTESANVIEHLKTHNNPTNISFQRLFIDYCLGISTDDSYANHLFTEQQGISSWIIPKNDEQLLFEIWNIDPYSNPVLCELCCSYTILYEDFMKWWSQLISMNLDK